MVVVEGWGAIVVFGAEVGERDERLADPAHNAWGGQGPGGRFRAAFPGEETENRRCGDGDGEGRAAGEKWGGGTRARAMPVAHDPSLPGVVIHTHT